MSNEKLLDEVADEIIVCTKCSLSKTRTKAVPGVGSSAAQAMFIGEAPGQSEDIKGEPFVGAAGKFLDYLLSEAGLSREKVFITNVVKCRPPGNREPLPLEVETCTPYLDRQIRMLKPRLIVTLGKNSTACIFSKVNLPFDGITRVRGKFFKTSLLGMQVVVFPTFHPAAALYNEKYKEQLIEDFKLLGCELKKMIA
ncbi:MAG TPA: type-4 uracil-DNA glycosylase [Candidatus Bathyarchaeia archaeon]|nr:type-4 uracil-DNA glycosylase [Candidatus Bathyarchaeia archaeon]